MYFRREPLGCWCPLIRFVVLLLILQLLTTTSSGTVAASESEYSPDSPASQALIQLCMSDQTDVMTVGQIQDLFLQDKEIKTIDINVQDKPSGQTCLMASVLRGKPLTVELLLFQGADAAIPEKDGYTPQHGAAFQGRTDVMAVLHEHGIYKQEYHADGYLPYHRACWGQSQRHASFINYILKQGIINDVNVRSKDGKTCRDMTRNPQIIAVLDQWQEAATQQKSSEGQQREEL